MTVLEWFKSVKNKKIRELLLHRMESGYREVPCIYEAIASGFSWEDTKEGIKFWCVVYMSRSLDSLYEMVGGPTDKELKEIEDMYRAWDKCTNDLERVELAKKSGLQLRFTGDRLESVFFREAGEPYTFLLTKDYGNDNTKVSRGTCTRRNKVRGQQKV